PSPDSRCALRRRAARRPAPGRGRRAPRRPYGPDGDHRRQQGLRHPRRRRRLARPHPHLRAGGGAQRRQPRHLRPRRHPERAGRPAARQRPHIAAGGLSFSGVASVDVHTHDLSFTADTPLRLFKAPVGGPFADVTESMGMGSYRARGSSGGFSQFLIVADLRSESDVVEQKLDALDAAFAKGAAAIPTSVRNVLQGSLSAIRTAWDGGDVRGAITAAEGFAAAVKAAADAGSMPNVWRSARDLDNVAGNLRAAAGTLRF